MEKENVDLTGQRVELLSRRTHRQEDYSLSTQCKKRFREERKEEDKEVVDFMRGRSQVTQAQSGDDKKRKKGNSRVYCTFCGASSGVILRQSMIEFLESPQWVPWN